jgi:hypothetical protein
LLAGERDRGERLFGMNGDLALVAGAGPDPFGFLVCERDRPG